MNKVILEEQIKEVCNLQPGLVLDVKSCEFILTGKYEFNLIWENAIRSGMREVTISIPFSFPSTAPKLKVDEMPKGMSHIYDDKSVCLATTGELIEFLSREPTVKDYIDKFIESFLFTMKWYEDYGCYPFGEREHGWKGLKSYYIENWGLTSDQYWKLVVLISGNKYRGHIPCICGSGVKIRNCHGAKMLPILTNQDLREQFIYEAMEIYQGETNGEK